MRKNLKGLGRGKLAGFSILSCGQNSLNPLFINRKGLGFGKGSESTAEEISGNT